MLRFWLHLRGVRCIDHICVRASPRPMNTTYGQRILKSGDARRTDGQTDRPRHLARRALFPISRCQRRNSHAHTWSLSWQGSHVATCRPCRQRRRLGLSIDYAKIFPVEPKSKEPKKKSELAPRPILQILISSIFFTHNVCNTVGKKKKKNSSIMPLEE